jgi:hypothetical protein
MISVREQESLMQKIESLSELEFSEVLRQMAGLIHRNKWNHIIDDCFDIETFEDELDEMTANKDKWYDRAIQAEEKLNEIRDIL